jgi:hypothetical protein
MDDLASREIFAVTRSTSVCRGWSPRNISIAGKELTDADFNANFEQKGVDMRIGLDIAGITADRRMNRVTCAKSWFTSRRD